MGLCTFSTWDIVLNTMCPYELKYCDQLMTLDNAGWAGIS